MTWVAIGLGGAVGAMARHGVNHVAHTHWFATRFPVGIVIVNVAGCLVIGLLAGLLAANRIVLRPHWREFVFVGVLGGFTTFSTYAVQAVLLADGHPALAAAYVVATPVAALVAVTAGVVAARASTRLTRRLARQDDVPETTPSDLAEDQR